MTTTSRTKFPFEEYTRVAFVPTIADIDAPTIPELDAGTDISCDLTKDGLNPGGSTNALDSGSLCSKVDSQEAGTVGYQMELKAYLYRDQDNNIVLDEGLWPLVNWGDRGHIVVRRGPRFDAAWYTGQPVEVYKIQWGEPIPAASASNAQQTFTAPTFVQDANVKATVTAGS